METSCNRDSLGSVGLVCRNSTMEAANRHWLGQGIRRRKRRKCLAGIRRRKRRIGTDLDRNSTTEAANSHCLEKLAQRKRVIFGKIWRSAT